MKQQNLIDYIARQRWCNFKSEVAQNKVTDIVLDMVPFDDGNKNLILGTAQIAEENDRYFFMPISLGEKKGADKVEIDGVVMHDAMQDEDYWPKLLRLFKDNNNKVVFSDGTFISYYAVSNDNSGIKDNFNAKSKPLNVEQSNTTLMVGDKKLAFKQDRMIESMKAVSTELEMNMKLMQAGADIMPKTHGAFLMRKPDGTQATLGIVQDYVDNRGDLWAFANRYLLGVLRETKEKGLNKVNVNDYTPFVQLMRNLGDTTSKMGHALSTPNNDPNFEPLEMDDAFLEGYRRNMTVLLYQVKKNIIDNYDLLPDNDKPLVNKLLNNWDITGEEFVSRRIDMLKSAKIKGKLVRVHGDYHLGQVLITKTGDLKVIDFAGEPGLPLELRRQKYPESRDFSGMYRSIDGYLGRVVAETYASTGETIVRANGTTKNVTDRVEELWAQEALKPLLDDAIDAFMSGRSLDDPMLALEVLRKNLYEVKYEASNRPDMLNIPLHGLNKLYENDAKQKQAIIIKTKKGGIEK